MASKWTFSLSKIFQYFYILPAIIIHSVTAMGNETHKTNSTAKIAEDSRIKDCTLLAQNIATGLGSVVLVETLFCCFVFYCWIKKQRRRIRKFTTASKNGHDNRASQKETKHKATPIKDGKRDVGYLLRRFFRSKRYQPTQSPKEINDHADIDVEPGTDIYSTAYEECMKADSANHQTNKSKPSKPINEACYHVLEEPDSPLSQGAQDSLYYCSEDCVDQMVPGKINNSPHAQTGEVCYHVLEEPESPAPQGTRVDKPCQGTRNVNTNDVFYHVLEETELRPQKAQQAGSLYYRSEDCVENLTHGTPDGLAKPKPNALKPKIPQFKKQPAFTPQKPLPYQPQKQSKNKNRKPGNAMGKPLVANLGLKKNVIQEMKSRAAMRGPGNEN